ncbi:MAG TPA: ATP-binding protein [Pyrinomonadaceae bacterium]|nr:ATP-binding protein [Pyrinomonadaceae bacterium]
MPTVVTGEACMGPVDLAYTEEHDRRLLIVDDEERVRSLFALCLSERFSCETAANAQEALDWLQRAPFALVITDMQMPGIGGVELLRKVNELYRDTAVIIVSGVDRTQRVIDAVRMGAYDYLLKPCDLDVLELCVERALERRTLLRNARKYKEDLEARNVELARRKADLERVQAQLVHSEKMASLGQLAAGVAHELNNPAGFILSNMSALPEYVRRLEKVLSTYDAASLSPVDSEVVAAAKRAVDYDHILGDLNSIATDSFSGAERIQGIVQNLRLFSRLDEAELKEVDVHEGIESTIRLLSRYYTSPSIALRRVYGKLPRISCYAGQLNQVWVNLLVNAAQAIGQGSGEVSIKTSSQERTVAVSVSDTGSGIAPEHINRIFDPFFTTKPVGEGTGLGLSISHGIIARHGGSLSVESTVGRGTTFNIVLPVRPQLVEPPVN